MNFPKMTFQKRSHNVKTNVEATFLKRFCACWDLVTKPISFFLYIMNVQSDDVRNRWVDLPSHRGDNTFAELFP